MTPRRPSGCFLWAIFKCGIYSLPHLKIAHAGRNDPVGEIILESTKGQVSVQAGAGLLLRVDSTGAALGASSGD